MNLGLFEICRSLCTFHWHCRVNIMPDFVNNVKFK